MLRDMYKFNETRFSKVSIKLDNIYKNFDSKSFLNSQIKNNSHIKTKYLNTKEEDYNSAFDVNRHIIVNK